MKKFIFIALGVLFFSPLNTFALEFKDDKVLTSSGGELTIERYNWLLTRKTMNEIDSLPVDVLEIYNSPGLVVLGSTSSAINSTYVYDESGYVVDVEHDVDKFNTYSSDLSRNYFYETASKIINLEYIYDKDSGVYLVEFHNTWKKTPSIKSFDVIAVRWSGTPNVYNAYGMQECESTVNYAYNGSNMKLESKGVGISMNLVDNGTYHKNHLYVLSTRPFGTVFASYQHATRNVTLEQSKAYNFSASGLGGVVGFVSSTVRGYYDAMPGLSLSTFSS